MNAKKILGLGSAVALLLTGQAASVTRRVATAQELYEALVELNGQGVQNVIELTGSDYDVSAYRMKDSGDWKCNLYAESVTIRGKSSNPRGSVVFGDHTERIFFIRNARLHDLTVSNGCATASYGPGVSGKGYPLANAVCSNCVITCCEGRGIDNGGAGYVTLLDCEVCGNKSNHGGGATGCTIRGGSLHDNVAASSGGGGLNNNAYGVKVYRNTALKGGGFSGNGACVMDGCEIYDNTATGTGSSEGGGGAMCINSSSMSKFVLTNCVLRGNSAVYGGAAHDATFIDCVVSNNVATHGGGGFNVRFYESTVCSNTATSGGGAVYSGLVVGGVLSNNFAKIYGGGTHSVVVSNATLACNVSESNGAGAYGGTLVGCTIVRNLLRPAVFSTRTDGAGVYRVTARDCTIAGNAIRGSNNYGGGAMDSTLVGCRIYDNYGIAGSAVHGGSAVDCVISNNVSPTGQYTIRCTTKLEGCQISAQQIESPGSVQNCTFTGGGLSVTIAEGANAYTSGTFSASSSYILSGQAQKIAATNCLFYGNSVSVLIQGPRNTANVTLPFVNCTFVRNSCDVTVDAVPGTAGVNGSASFENCIFADNHKWNGTTPSDFSPEGSNSSQVSLVNCLIQTPVSAGWSCQRYENIITNSPKFDVKGACPYSIKYGSPARGKGRVMDWMASATDVRGEGYPRLRDGLVDLGCYECWLDPVGLLLLFH